jgi:hypothetical protein
MLTVLGNDCCGWLGTQLKGHEQTQPKQLYRRFVETDEEMLLLLFRQPIARLRLTG